MTADPSRLGVYVLDVGQGDCTFIVPPAGEGAPILFDCNDAYVAERFVANHRIKHLRAVVASHLDQDHIRGLLPFLQTYFQGGGTLEWLVLGADRAPRPGSGRDLTALVERAIEWEATPPCAGFVLKTPVRDRAGPLRLAEGPDWSVDLVLPFEGTRLQALAIDGDEPNLCSAVLRISRRGSAVEIFGDATFGSLERLEGSELRAVAIRPSHHGGEIREHGKRWKTFEQLYDEVGAEHAMISAGTNNQHGHPRADHVAAIRRQGNCRVRCTQLTSRCHPHPLALRDEARRLAGVVMPAYRHDSLPGHPSKSRRPKDEVPCMGSMVMWLDGVGKLEVEPRPGGEHDDLLAKIRDPMCQR